MPLSWGLPGRIGEEIPVTAAERVQHDLARGQVRLRPEPCRGPPGGHADLRCDQGRGCVPWRFT